MAITVTRRYDYQLGPIEQVTIEVLNDRYSRIVARRWHATRNYAIELATLAPEPRQHDTFAWRWLAAAGVMVLGIVGLIAALLYGAQPLPLSTMAVGIVVLMLLAALFAGLFLLNSSRRIIFHSRFSQVPLVVIPLPLRHIQPGKAFAAELSQLAQKNRARLHHTDQELRAGELRMLRRLAEEGAITSTSYDQAKHHLLRTAG